MQISKKEKSFRFFLHFFILDQILNILKNKDDSQSLYISEITDCQRCSEITV